MKSRIVLILIALTMLWTLMIGRAGYLQLVPDARLQSLQKRQFETVVTLNPRRGDVTDRNGHELAVSMTTYSLFADPKILEEPHEVIRMLAHELKMPSKLIAEKLRNHKKRFVWVQRGLEKPVRDAIAEQNIRGLGFVEESKRIYPNDRLLAHVLGFVGRDESGLEGLELRYNEQLEAAKKKVSMRKDARGRPLIVNGQVFNEVPDGADVQLTIDRELQFILEQELAQTVHKHEADSAVGVVLDAQTSEVLAMASSPTFDPNRAGDFAMDRKRNKVVTDSFEPGSTMKTFLIAGALGQGLVTPTTKFDLEGGKLRIGKRVIREADAHHNFKVLTVSEILAVSSNVGATKIAFKMGGEKLDETLRNFGFGQRSGIDLPGEAKGILQPLPWREHLLANISFGHGIAVTPLQIANAYASIANGGWLRQPYIVRSIHDHETNETTEMKVKTTRRVLTDEVVAKMRTMLVGVTSPGGSGLNARVPGFPVAGKTGTAQKVNPNGRGYLPGGYVSSFAGFIPANDPRFVIYIAVDHPRKEYYGGSVAAPVFSRVASFAVRRAGLAPVLPIQDEPQGETKIAPQAAVDFDSVDGDAPVMPETWTQAAAREIENAAATEAGVAVPTTNPSGLATVYPPKTNLVLPPPSELASVSAVNETNADATTPISSEPGALVPDLAGLTLREVLGRVTGSGMHVQVKGQGFVTHTIPAAGAHFSENKDMTVFLSRRAE